MLEDIGTQLPGHVGEDEAGGDHIGAHAFWTEFGCDGLGQADHTCLRGGIVALAGIAMDAYDGADVDDRPAALPEHHGRDGVDEVERALEVDRQDGIPLGLAHAEHEAVFGDSGVIDEDVDAAEGVHDLLDGIVRLLEVGGVGGDGQHADAKGFEFLLGLLADFVDDQIREGDIGAFLCKLEGDLFSDAPRRARNQRDLSFQ